MPERFAETSALRFFRPLFSWRAVALGAALLACAPRAEAQETLPVQKPARTITTADLTTLRLTGAITISPDNPSGAAERTLQNFIDARQAERSDQYGISGIQLTYDPQDFPFALDFERIQPSDDEVVVTAERRTPSYTPPRAQPLQGLRGRIESLENWRDEGAFVPQIEERDGGIMLGFTLRRGGTETPAWIKEGIRSILPWGQRQ